MPLRYERYKQSSLRNGKIDKELRICRFVYCVQFMYVWYVCRLCEICDFTFQCYAIVLYTLFPFIRLWLPCTLYMFMFRRALSLHVYSTKFDSLLAVLKLGVLLAHRQKNGYRIEHEYIDGRNRHKTASSN